MKINHHILFILVCIIIIGLLSGCEPKAGNDPKQLSIIETEETYASTATISATEAVDMSAVNANNFQNNDSIGYSDGYIYYYGVNGLVRESIKNPEDWTLIDPDPGLFPSILVDGDDLYYEGADYLQKLNQHDLSTETTEFSTITDAFFFTNGQCAFTRPLYGLLLPCNNEDGYIEVTEFSVDEVIAYGEYWFCIAYRYNNSKNPGVWRVDKDGKNVVQILSTATKVYGWKDQLFFVNNDFELCSCDFEGNLIKNYNTKLDCSIGSFMKPVGLTIYGDYIYYVGRDRCLFRMTIDGKNEQKLTDIHCEGPVIADEWILYSSGNSMFKVHLDGTDNQKLQFSGST